MCTVLDTGAGKKFVSRTYLQRTEVRIRTGTRPLISDTNGRPMNIEDVKTLFVYFGKFFVK